MLDGLKKRIRRLSKRKFGKKFTLTTAFALLSGMLLFYHGVKPTPARKYLSMRSPISPVATLIPTVTATPAPTAVPTQIPRIAAVEVTTAPVPTASPTAVPTIEASLPATDYEAYFDEYSSAYKVDKNLLKRIANCESHFHPGSVNGIYGGMFQFAPSTWQSTRSSMGADTNTDLRFDAKEAINTAAFKIANGGADAWAACL